MAQDDGRLGWDSDVMRRFDLGTKKYHTVHKRARYMAFITMRQAQHAPFHILERTSKLHDHNTMQRGL